MQSGGGPVAGPERRIGTAWPAFGKPSWEVLVQLFRRDRPPQSLAQRAAGEGGGFWDASQGPSWPWARQGPLLPGGVCVLIVPWGAGLAGLAAAFRSWAGGLLRICSSFRWKPFGVPGAGGAFARCAAVCRTWACLAQPHASGAVWELAEGL